MTKETSREKPRINEESGFQIMAFVFSRSRSEQRLRHGKYEGFLKKARVWFLRHPNVIFVAPGEGMGWDMACVSLHKSYSEFVQFKREHDMQFSDTIVESVSFVANMDPGAVIKPLKLEYLADIR